MVISEYERKRLENIQRNQELMQAIGLQQAKEDMEARLAQQRQTKQPAKRQKSHENSPSTPRRTSRRLRGYRPENSEAIESAQVEEELQDNEEVKAEELELTVPPPEARKKLGEYCKGLKDDGSNAEKFGMHICIYMCYLK